MISKFWTPENRQKIIEAISQGAPINTAAKFAGVPPKTLRSWLLRGEAVDENTVDPDDIEMYEFWKLLSSTMADVQLKCIGNYKAGTRHGVDWRAMESYLSRVNPEEWSSKQQIEFSGDISVNDVKGAQRLIQEQFGKIGRTDGDQGS